MNKIDKDGTLTKEYIDYVKGLEREDLESFYIGADLLYNDLQQRIKKTIEHIRLEYCNNEDINDCWHEGMKEILEILKGEDNE